MFKGTRPEGEKAWFSVSVQKLHDCEPLKHGHDNVCFYSHCEDYLGRLQKVVHTEPGTYSIPVTWQKL